MSFINCFVSKQKAEGVVGYLDAKNIKSGNFFVQPNGFDSDEPEEVFSSGEIRYAGQPVGLILAETQAQALKAAGLVRVTYRDARKPVVTIKEAINDPARIKPHLSFGPPGSLDSGNFEGS